MFYFLLYTFDFILTSLEMGINFVNKQNILKLKKIMIDGQRNWIVQRNKKTDFLLNKQFFR